MYFTPDWGPPLKIGWRKGSKKEIWNFWKKRIWRWRWPLKSWLLLIKQHIHPVRTIPKHHNFSCSKTWYHTPHDEADSKKKKNQSGIRWGKRKGISKKTQFQDLKNENLDLQKYFKIVEELVESGDATMEEGQFHLKKKLWGDIAGYRC